MTGAALAILVVGAANGQEDEPGASAAAAPQTLAQCFADVLAKTGGEYVAARSAFVAHGDEALSFLDEQTARDDWKTKVFTALLRWYIQAPEEPKELGDRFVRAILQVRIPRGLGAPSWLYYLDEGLADSAQAVPFFTEVLLKDTPDEEGASQIVFSEEAVPDGEWWVWEMKHAAIVTLLRTQDPTVPAVLMEMLRQWTTPAAQATHRPARLRYVIERASAALGKVGDEQALEVLGAALEHERYPHLRAQYAAAIEAIEARVEGQQQ
jgi:hypothetical protein